MLDLAFASREPGEPFVTAASKTLWYDWTAPVTGLFRFRLQEADSGDPTEADFKLFTGDSLVALELAVEKSGKEISFDAKAGTRYRLRIESNRPSEQWDLAPLVLKWEPRFGARQRRYSLFSNARRERLGWSHQRRARR